MKEKIDYIFSISTGRCGSDYLAEIFNHVSGCSSFHEPDPIGNGRVMRQYSRGNVKSMEKFTNDKIKVVKSKKKHCQVYFESNHCFIKGFGWFIPKYISEQNIGVIILKRDKLKIAKSFQRIHASPLDSLGRSWISTPEMKRPLVKKPTTNIEYQIARVLKFIFRAWKFLYKRLFLKVISYPQWLLNYELKLLQWYVEETFAKAEVFKQMYPGIKYYEVDINELNNPESVLSMFEYFGCKAKKSISNYIGKPTNTRRDEKDV